MRGNSVVTFASSTHNDLEVLTIDFLDYDDSDHRTKSQLSDYVKTTLSISLSNYLGKDHLHFITSTNRASMSLIKLLTLELSKNEFSLAYKGQINIYRIDPMGGGLQNIVYVVFCMPE